MDSAERPKSMPPPLFPQWSNGLLRWGMVGATGMVLFVPCLLMGMTRSPVVTGQYQVVEQPVEFDHRHHVSDLGIDCLYCHAGAERSAYAGVPPTSLCMNCHNQVWDRAGALAPVRRSYAEDQPIRWRRVHALPDFVFFNHAAHVTRGVGCLSCHGQVGEMARVYQVAPLNMAWCIDCHRHPASALRPGEFITEEAWAPTAREQERIGSELVVAHAINPPLTCSGCHR